MALNYWDNYVQFNSSLWVNVQDRTTVFNLPLGWIKYIVIVIVMIISKIMTFSNGNVWQPSQQARSQPSVPWRCSLTVGWFTSATSRASHTGFSQYRFRTALSWHQTCYAAKIQIHKTVERADGFSARVSVYNTIAMRSAGALDFILAPTG